MAEIKNKKIATKKASPKKSIDKVDLLIEWVKAYMEREATRGGNVDFDRKQEAQATLSRIQEAIRQL
tara:strand:- start:493 stop:693 length:201 start_codon:yes stop_codon:yes gene_type:complete